MTDSKIIDPILVQGYKSPFNGVIYGSHAEYMIHASQYQVRLAVEKELAERELSRATKERIGVLIEGPRLIAENANHLAQLLIVNFREIVELSPKLPVNERLFPDEWFPKVKSIIFDGSWIQAASDVLSPVSENRSVPSEIFFTGNAEITCDEDFDIDVFRNVFPYMGFTTGSKIKSSSSTCTIHCDVAFAVDDFSLMYEKFSKLSQIAQLANEFDEQISASIKAHIKDDPECNTYSGLLMSLKEERRKLQEKVDAVSEQVRFTEKDIVSRCAQIKKRVTSDYPNPHLAEYQMLDATLNFGEAGPYAKLKQSS